MTERIAGWRCIGCGKVDAPAPCIGICQDRKVELVLAADHDAVVARVAELEATLALIARITPRDEEWKASWLALQERARKVLTSSSPHPSSPRKRGSSEARSA